MAVPHTKRGKLWLGFQAAKGTPATTPKYSSLFVGSPSMNPVPEIARPDATAMTRAAARSYLQRWNMDLSFELLAGPLMHAGIAYWALGGVSVTGAGPYVHEIVPAANLPYATLWVLKPNGEIERFHDVICTSAEWSAGSDTETTISVEATAGNWTHQVTTAPSDPATDDTPYFRFTEAKDHILVATVANTCITEIGLTISNDTEPVYGQDIYPCDVVSSGRMVTGSFGEPYEAAAAQRRRRVLTGTDAGTTLQTVTLVEQIDYGFQRDAENLIDFSVPEATITEYPLDSDAGGGPAVVPAAWEAEPQDDDHEIVVTATNDLATLGA